ncbi:NAC domain-containing protein 2-like [Telopea speciosissima]|uniref:NAC domain-containing protein 2-like n=1 Tax=Telopea speciosissima TaxID=54955 RepID=UPI001CC484E2|nr:NAC domain-containing protein 2-like [Telopea speciosissima]
MSSLLSAVPSSSPPPQPRIDQEIDQIEKMDYQSHQSDNVVVQKEGEAVEAGIAVGMDDNSSDYFNSFPPGFRFRPFDHELIDHYLKKKVMKQPLPMNQIREVQLYNHNPQDLAEKYPPNGEKEWYFFTPRDRKYRNGNRPKRAAGNGYWKATGADTEIYSKGQLVGFRKALVFYIGKAPKGEKSNWIMHEFRVKESATNRTNRGPNDMMLDEWVLCRIYRKPDKSLRRVHNAEIQAEDVDILIENNDLCDVDDEDSGPANTPNNSNLSEMECNYSDMMGNYMGLINPSGEGENDFNHSLQYNLPLPNSESYHMFTGYGDFISSVEPISVNPPMYLVENYYQLSSLATGHAYCDYLDFKQENSYMLPQNDFSNKDYLDHFSSFPYIDEILPNTNEMGDHY